MENMDKELTVQNGSWQMKIPQKTQNLSAQFVCPSPEFLWKKSFIRRL